MLKEWLKSPSGISTTGLLGYLFLRLTFFTIRQNIIDQGGLELIKSGQPVIVISWHSRLLGIFPLIRHFPRLTIILSPAQDGLIMKRAVNLFGGEVALMSNNKFSIAAYRHIHKQIKNGSSIGTCPDGPRGPARKMALGVIKIAQASGIPMVPIAWSTRRHKRINSWDRMMIPSLFNRGVVYFGKPIYIPKKARDDEKIRLATEDVLNEMMEKADAEFGHPPDHAESRYGIKKEKS